jgi:rfaE bifunctional protein kinase chain/domain
MQEQFTVEQKINTIQQFKDLNVLVLGDVMLDIYDFCYEKHSKPIDSEMPGKRAFTAHESIKTLGGAGNVAANLASLHAQTSLISVTGDDGHHFTLQTIADSIGIRHTLLRDKNRHTTMKMRIYVDDSYLLRRDDETTDEISHEMAASIWSEFLFEIDHCNAVILSDYDKGFFTHDLAQKIITFCSQRSIPVIVDFKPPNLHYFKHAHIIVPNEKEANSIQPGFIGTPTLNTEMNRLHSYLRSKNTVVTLGGKGLCGYDGSGFFHIPGNNVRVVDAVGCGDTVRAALALGAALGLHLQHAGELANDAAAVIIQKRATATISPDEIIQFIRSK